MAELTDGCVRPARGPIAPTSETQDTSTPAAPVKEANVMRVRVGGEAIDFESSAFVAGEGFKPVKLADYKGKWIILCFYPGDFTFV